MQRVIKWRTKVFMGSTMQHLKLTLEKRHVCDQPNYPGLLVTSSVRPHL